MVAGAVWFCGAFFGLVLLLTFYVWFCVASRFPSGLLASGFRVLGLGLGLGCGRRSVLALLWSCVPFQFLRLPFWLSGCGIVAWRPGTERLSNVKDF